MRAVEKAINLDCWRAALRRRRNHGADGAAPSKASGSAPIDLCDLCGSTFPRISRINANNPYSVSAVIRVIRGKAWDLCRAM